MMHRLATTRLATSCLAYDFEGHITVVLEMLILSEKRPKVRPPSFIGDIYPRPIAHFSQRQHKQTFLEHPVPALT